MSGLRPSLGPFSGTAMMLNTVLGAGLLILPGLAAASVGSMSLWTWLVCALASVPLLGMFAILASRYPGAGGVGYIASRAFGELGNVVTSFLFLGAVFVGLPSIALTGGHYVAPALDVPAPLVAGAIVVLATAANLTLPRVASRIGSYVAGCVIVFITLLVGASAWVVLSTSGMDTSASIAAPLLPRPDAGMLAPFMLVFFAFTGWEVAIGTSAEYRDARRDVPIAIGASFAIAVIYYIACSLVVIGAGPAAYNNAPFLSILSPYGGAGTAVAIAAGTGAIIAANLFGAIWAVSRLVFSLADEGRLPKSLSTLRRGTPQYAVLATGSIILLVVALDGASLIDVATLFAIAGQNFLLIYAISAAALFVLERGLPARAIAVVSMSLVVVLVAVSGLNIAYPLILSIAGVALVVHGRTWRAHDR